MPVQEPTAAHDMSKDLHGKDNEDCAFEDENGCQDSPLTDPPQAASAVQPPPHTTPTTQHSAYALHFRRALKYVHQSHQQAQVIVKNIYASGRIWEYAAIVTAMVIVACRIIQLLCHLCAG